MVKTQIELPNARYAALRRVARAQQLTIAQAMNRAVELLVKTTPKAEQPRDAIADWHPPQIKGAKWQGLTPEELRDLAQETTTEAQFKERRPYAGH